MKVASQGMVKCQVICFAYCSTNLVCQVRNKSCWATLLIVLKRDISAQTICWVNRLGIIHETLVTQQILSVS
jgi:hypothetical protein